MTSVWFLLPHRPRSPPECSARAVRRHPLPFSPLHTIRGPLIHRGAAQPGNVQQRGPPHGPRLRERLQRRHLHQLWAGGGCGCRGQGWGSWESFQESPSPPHASWVSVQGLRWSPKSWAPQTCSQSPPRASVPIPHLTPTRLWRSAGPNSLPSPVYDPHPSPLLHPVPLHVVPHAGLPLLLQPGGHEALPTGSYPVRLQLPPQPPSIPPLPQYRHPTAPPPHPRETGRCTSPPRPTHAALSFPQSAARRRRGRTPASIAI